MEYKISNNENKKTDSIDEIENDINNNSNNNGMQMEIKIYHRHNAATVLHQLHPVLKLCVRIWNFSSNF